MHRNHILQHNTEHYLYGVRGFLGVLFKQQHGGSVHVDAELLLDARGLAMIYVPKSHKVPICKCRELQQQEHHNRGFFSPAHKQVMCIPGLQQLVDKTGDPDYENSFAWSFTGDSSYLGPQAIQTGYSVKLHSRLTPQQR